MQRVQHLGLPRSLKRLHILFALVAIAAPGAAAPGVATAATYQVGPGKPHANLQAVDDLLEPGDVVEVDGDAVYPGGVVFTRPGTAAQRIVIRGIRVNGLRPILSGATNTITFATPDPESPGDAASHYTFEGFEVTGGSFRCVYHQADDLIVRDVLVHDCPAHGILGADQGSGSMLMERVEVHHCGAGTGQHQVYMATDEVHHPGSVFRMRHCYLHDATGGNNVKSRAQRNEIHYNWIEGAVFHELELIGPDPEGADPNWSEDLAREDSDVVGNVLIKRNSFSVTRIGGDATGQSNGRYRFVNNTIVAGSSAVFRIFDGIQSVEMHNNVLHGAGGAGVNVIRQVEALWTDGEQIAGSNNWTTTGSTNVPASWIATQTGAHPGFADLAGNDLRPAAGSPLLGSANPGPQTPPTFPFPDPHFPPDHHPPQHAVESAPAVRAPDCDPDVGAFERAPIAPAWIGTGTFAWQSLPGATSYDVVKGDLKVLRSSQGDFAASLLSCLENDGTDTMALDAAAPAPGGCFYYLVRAVPGGSYDGTCPDQIGARSAEIQSSPFACP